MATGKLVCSPRKVRHPDPALRSAIDRVAARLRLQYPDLMQAEWIAERLLAGDDRVRKAVISGELATLVTTREVVA